MKKIIAIIALVIQASLAFAQLSESQQPAPLSSEKLLPDFNHLTPEAASLGRFGSNNVSEYSGVPSIKIPLLEVKSGDISFPIELYYEASGIKVEQEATFVGLGWNLSYGGSISHVICGNDDFRESNNNSQDYFNSNINVPSIDSPYFINHITYMGLLGYGGQWTSCLPPNEPNKYLLFNDMSKGNYVPDIFLASFCGQSISFYIDKTDNKAKILNDLPNKYKIEYTKGSVYPATFTITNDRGVSYQYTQGWFNYGSLDLRKCTTEAKFVEGTYPNEIASQVHNLVAERTSYHSLSNSPSGKYNKVYPSKIITRQGSISFTFQNRSDLNGAKAINSVEVSSLDGTKTDKVAFAYDYFREKNTAAPILGKGLKLTGLNVNSQKYKMEYDETQELPSYNSHSQDFWGYYNGRVNEKSMCASPKYMLNGNVVQTIENLGNANRYASEALSKVGVLTRITYPTGGSSCFEYEANRFTDAYFYPEVNENFNHDRVDYSVSAYGQGSFQQQSKTFTLTEEKYMYFCIMLYTPDASRFTASMSLRNATTGKIIQATSTPYGTGEKAIENTSNITLAPGTYILEVSVPKCNESRIPVAQCGLSYETVTTNSLSNRDKGGVSVGGGIRIKNIKNYDSSGTKVVGETRYEYKDGKLLSPTAMLERHYVDFSYHGSGGEKSVNFSFNFIAPTPNYLYVCNVGVPATVGYTTVTKQEMDKNGRLLTKTVLEYYNNSYEIDKSINNRTGNPLFYNKKGYLNGKLKSKTVSSSNGTVMYDAQYEYGKTNLGDVIYSKCIPTFLPEELLSKVEYDVALWRKPIEWSYLTKMSETSYKKGKAGETKVTTYTYTTANLQPSSQTVVNNSNAQSSKIIYWYPADAKSLGTSALINKHEIGELTGFEKYDKGTLAGGARFDYTTKNGYPVVSKCYTITPGKQEIEDMTVNEYDDHGNILQYTGKDGVPVTILWSYDYQYPVMKIEGATYQEVKSCSSIVTTLGGRKSLTKDVLLSIHNAISGKSVSVTSFLYDKRFNISLIITPNGYETYYEYDEYGRLVKTNDRSGTIQKIMYNYKVK